MGQVALMVFTGIAQTRVIVIVRNGGIPIIGRDINQHAPIGIETWIRLCHIHERIAPLCDGLQFSSPQGINPGRKESHQQSDDD